MAFIRILDPFKLNTIASKKSFCQLERRPFDLYKDLPLEGLSWMVSGAPANPGGAAPEAASENEGLGVCIFNGLLIATHRETRGDFDFLTMLTVRDRDNYPLRYGGVSGGGIWLVPLKAEVENDPTSIQAPGPIFAGVVFYEQPTGEDMRLFAHGPDSIYSVGTLDKIAGVQ